MLPPQNHRVYIWGLIEGHYLHTQPTYIIGFLSFAIF